MSRGRSSRSIEAARRFAERRRREDEAPRLRDMLPNLASLRLEVQEKSSDGGAVYSAHVRHVLVERAPMLFCFPCGDGPCDGEHDLTNVMMRHLDAGEDRFELSSACHGTAGTVPCKRELQVVAIATRSG